MYKVAVIGAPDTVMGFRALGLETCPAQSAEEAHRAFRRLTATDGEYAVIYVEETLAAALSKEIDKFKDSPVPAVILIPGRGGSTGIGSAALHAAVERAVGTDILSE